MFSFAPLGDVSHTSVHVQTELQPSAILDLHFHPISDRQDICATVSSTGTLDVFRFLGPSTESRKLVALKTIRIPGVDEDVLFLSFTWHPSIHDVVAVTTSQGNIHIMRLGQNNEAFLSSSVPIISHTLEAWCVAIYPSVSTTSPSQVADGSELFTLFTGGDDSALNYATCKVTGGSGAECDPFQIDTPFEPKTVSGHEAGVTAILPLPLRGEEQGSDLVVTGSYDDHIRVYAITPLHKTWGLKKARLLAAANLGGGVWRLRLVALDDRGPGVAWRAWILASCMHAGARIVELRGTGDENCEMEVLGRFEEHKSMNYGSDVQPSDTHGNLVCVSTSFYDKLLCLWQFPLARDGCV